ncbi:MAG: 3-hydroxyacyl-CoA dehydrogenase NAD-binding domain-containing protein [Gammaproteobacteria bacterium]|nr:3-hydroxyacyl-CoA dehydrogenase NAD-binding domain-containing protein [Gammaproteobacteria bacterium]MDH5803333.1 3-hydroxyacyl-CoA dehydrogenase NAD-binding domain-containing protein [Gammaproteobacteria bacterium]
MANNYKHWHLETDSDGIAWLHADKEDSSTNTLSEDMLKELETIVDHLETTTPKGLVILSDKSNGFVAGADIKQFTIIKNQEQAAEFIRLGQGIYNRIEKLRFPTVCLIHGFCMGGGTELAMACRYRIADNDPKTKIGLPEIQLGIFPAFGGATRLPHLVGAPSAMDLMLSGRAISAGAARKIGLVDYAVPNRDMKKGARNIVLNRPSKTKLPLWKKLTNHSLIRPWLAKILRKKVAARARQEHYPAPYELIDLWVKHADNRQRMLQGEEQAVSKLVLGETAQNLIRVFFLQEKLKSVGDKSLFTPKRVHVIGAGVMGADIAAWCALQGMTVTVQDRKEEHLAKVLQKAYKLYSKKLKKPLLVQAAMDRLVPDMNGLGLAHADVVIEAIFENLEAKHALLKEVEAVIKPDALLATNTSSIPIETLAQVLKDPSRLVGIHFFNPVAKMLLVEIVNGTTTSADATAKAAAFTRHISRLPLPTKSAPGFLVNRVLMPYLVEAVVMESEGIPGPVIDKAAVGFGMPMGPIALADTVGLDICLSVAQILSEKLDLEVPPRLKQLVDSGHLGIKSGRGFYKYKNGKKEKSEQSGSSHSIKDIQDRMILRMVNEVVACLREQIVDNADLIDAGIIFGTGFAPFRGGPLHFRDKQGVEKLRERLQELQQKHGERFKADAGWS